MATPSPTTEKKAPKKTHLPPVNYAAILKGETISTPVVLPPPAVQPGWVQITKKKGQPLTYILGPLMVNAYLEDAAEREEIFKDRCLLHYRVSSQLESQLQENDRLGDLSPYHNAVVDPVALMDEDKEEQGYVSDESRSDED